MSSATSPLLNCDTTSHKISLEDRIQINYWRKHAVEAFIAEDYATWTLGCEQLVKLLPPRKPKRPAVRIYKRKLTDPQVRLMRASFAKGQSVTTIARRFHLHTATAWGVVYNRIYRDLL